MCAWGRPETYRVTQYQAVRTLRNIECTTYIYQILRQRRLLLQPQHHHRCQTLEDPLSRGRDSSNRNSFVVLSVVQILQPSEEPRTTASCSTWFRSTVGSSSLNQESVAQVRHLDQAATVFCDTIRSRRCHRFSRQVGPFLTWRFKPCPVKSTLMQTALEEHASSRKVS